MKFYGEDLCKEQLKTQLDIMATNLPPQTGRHDLPSLLEQLMEMSEAQRSLLCQVCTWTSTVLVMHTTNAVTYLWLNMNHIHKDLGLGDWQ